MPKRRSDDLNPESRTDSGLEIKSRSGRLVKPKVYNDGTIALMEEKPLHADQTDADDLPSRPTAYATLDDEDEDVSDASEGSYGSRTRPARGAHSNRMDNSRPSRRTVTRPPRNPNSTHATGYGGGGVFKQAAVEILRSERRLMATGEITKLAIRRGLVRCTGKTPEATMASALYTDIKRKEENSLFVRPREGLFGLREWVDEGVVQIQPQNTTTHNPLPSSYPHIYGAMDSDNGTGTAGHHFLDGEQQPGASQDSGDRLMELLCAAEEINREVSPSSEEGEEEEQDGAATAGGAGGAGGGYAVAGPLTVENAVPTMSTGEDHQDMGVLKVEQQAPEEAKEAILKADQPGATLATTALVERHESSTFFSPPPKHAINTTTIGADGLKSAELQVQKMESLFGTAHPEVGLSYLHLAKLYMASGSPLSAEMKAGAALALQKAEEAMTAYQQHASSLSLINNKGNGINNNMNDGTTAVCVDTTTSLPGTAIKSTHQGFLVPAAPPTAPGPVKLGKERKNTLDQTPAGPVYGGHGPVAAPTPLALEEARGWNSGPFAMTTTTGLLSTSALPPASICAGAPTATAAGKYASASVGGGPLSGVLAAAAAAGGGGANGVASDTENDADVEICLPAPGKMNGGQRLPLHAVTAPPLTAT